MFPTENRANISQSVSLLTLNAREFSFIASMLSIVRCKFMCSFKDVAASYVCKIFVKYNVNFQRFILSFVYLLVEY